MVYKGCGLSFSSEADVVILVLKMMVCITFVGVEYQSQYR